MKWYHNEIMCDAETYPGVVAKARHAADDACSKGWEPISGITIDLIDGQWVSRQSFSQSAPTQPDLADLMQQAERIGNLLDALIKEFVRNGGPEENLAAIRHKLVP